MKIKYTNSTGDVITETIVQVKEFKELDGSSNYYRGYTTSGQTRFIQKTSIISINGKSYQGQLPLSKGA